MTFFSNAKQRSYVLNPRGKPLYEDSDRFGTKMLEKMGWSKGKGLGANMDGEQNFIRVAHKADQRGIGFQDRDDQWTQHANEFNSLLKSLDNSNSGSRAVSDNDDAEGDGLVCTGFGFASNEKKTKKLEGSITTKLSGKSLEEQSKTSKARVHYKKFTRGKDLSRYSEKDLANIFGKKEFIENETIVGEQIESMPGSDETVGDLNFGITTIETGTSISEYFKNKKLKLKNGNTSAEFVSIMPAVANDVDEEQPQKKKKKRKHKTSELAEQGLNIENLTEKSDSISDELQTETIAVDKDDVDGQSKKKKKKRKNKISEPTEGGVVDVNLTEKSGTDSMDTQIEEDVEQPKSEKKKKKKKKLTSEIDISAIDNAETEVPLGEKTTKRRRRKDGDAELEAEKEAPSKDFIEKPSTSRESNSNNVSNEQPINIVSNILSALIKNKQHLTGHSLTEGGGSSLDPNDTLLQMPQYISFGDNIYEINRYQAEVFRFLDLDGFTNANLCDLAGYGYSKNLELKVTSKTQDNNKISDLWDHALISKYGKEAVRAKKQQKYSIKTLKKKNLFKGI